MTEKKWSLLRRELKESRRADDTEYFKVHYVIFKIFALGNFRKPQKETFAEERSYMYTTYRVVHSLLSYGLMLSYVIELILNIQQFQNMLMTAFYGIASFGVCVKLLAFSYKHENFQRITYSLEVKMKEHRQDFKMINKVRSWGSYISKLFLLIVFIAVILFVINGGLYMHEIGMFSSDNNFNMNQTVFKSSRFPLHAYYPLDLNTKLRYMLAYLHQSIGMIILGLRNPFLDCTCVTMMLHLNCQFRILQQSIRYSHILCFVELDKRFDVRKDFVNGLRSILSINDTNDVAQEKFLEMYNLEYARLKRVVHSKYSKESIEKSQYEYWKKCVQHHNDILRTCSLLQDVFSITFMTILFLSCSITFLLLQLDDQTSPESISQIFVLIGVLSQLGIYCFVAEETRAAAEECAHASTLTAWYDLSVQARRVLVALVMRAQKPVYFAAGGLVPMTNNSFVLVIRTAVSYFTVLKSMQNRNI